jgi:ABC-type Mn2+/Zn2+ transport system ATPase subunit
MAGVTAPSSSHVIYNGRDLYKNLVVRSTLGYVPQASSIVTYRSARLCGMPQELRLPPTPRPRRKAGGQDAIDVLGLGKTHLPVKKLSGGQRKRANMAVGPKQARVFFLVADIGLTRRQRTHEGLRRLADAQYHRIYNARHPGPPALRQSYLPRP